MKIAPEHWPAVSELLDEALDLPSEEARREWLRGLPPHARPFSDTLEQLLRDHAHVQTGDFLAKPAAAARLGARRNEAVVEGAGRIIGPYRLLHELGRGGMGSVWLAERVDGLLKRAVALKLPHPGLAARGLAERLARERDILAALAHPHIARLYDAGVTADGQPYISLEYIEGRTIVEDCDAQRRDVRARIELFLQVLDAVQYAHAHLVIHRDLKPSNVLVDAQGQVKLLDFGVAKLMIDGRGEVTELTLDAGAALTPDYASPEQILGKPLSTASDVYSLGVLLYQLLTGARPYRLLRQGGASLAQAIAGVDIPRPSAAIAGDEPAAAARGATARQLARALRGDLDTIVLKALKAQPEQRYESVEALRADLQRHLKGEPIRARPESRLYVLGKFVARNRLAVAGAAASVLAVLIAAVGYAIQAQVAARERDYAQAQADRSDATARFMNDLLVEAAQSQRPISVNELLARSEKLIADSYRDDPNHRAAIFEMLANYYRMAGGTSKAADLIARAIAAARGAADPALLDQLRCTQAFVNSLLGRVDEAKSELESILGGTIRDPRHRVTCTLYRSSIAQNNGDKAAALRYAQQAQQALRAAKLHLPEVEAEVLGALGTAYKDNGRYADAETHFAESLQRYAELGRGRGHNAQSVRNNLALLRLEAGIPRAALSMLDEILSIGREEQSTAPPPLYMLVNRAAVLQLVGRYDEAVVAAKSVLELARERGNDELAVGALLTLEAVAKDCGDLSEAERLFAQAQAITDARLAPSSRSAMRTRLARGLLDLALGKPQAAYASFDVALRSPSTLPGTVVALIGRADAQRGLGRFDAALDDARRAVSMAEMLRSMNSHSVLIGCAWLAVGQVLNARGDSDGAARALETAIEHLSQTVEPAQVQLVTARRLLERLHSPS